MAALASIGESKGTPCEQAVSAAATQLGQAYNATEVTSIQADPNKDNVYQVSVINNDERLYLSVEVSVEPTDGSCKVTNAVITDVAS